ncbi:hypothetical protein D3C76_1284220 [compost metagenome]
MRQFSKCGGRQFIGDQYKAFWPGIFALNGIVEMEQQTLAQAAQIARAFLQITISQGGKLLGKAFDNLFDGPFSHRTFVHFGKELAT